MTTAIEAPPAHVAILDHMLSWMNAHAVATAARLQIADHLGDKSMSIDALADSVGAHPRALYRLMRALSDEGIFHQDSYGNWSNTPASHSLRKDADPSVRDIVRYFTDPWHIKGWQNLEYSIRTGRQAAEFCFGKSLWEYFETDSPEEEAVFQGGMTNMSMMQAPAIAASYDFRGINTLVDVAGGRGYLLATVMQQNPHLRGVLIDLPHVIDSAQNGPLAPMKHRASMHVLDMFRDPLPAADAYMMKFICHDWSDDDNEVMLRNVLNSGGPNSRLLVIDQVIPDRGPARMAKLIDLEMLLFTTGQERTESEWHNLFRRSGWRVNQIIRTPAELCIIEGVPA